MRVRAIPQGLFRSFRSPKQFGPYTVTLTGSMISGQPPTAQPAANAGETKVGEHARHSIAGKYARLPRPRAGRPRTHRAARRGTARGTGTRAGHITHNDVPGPGDTAGPGLRRARASKPTPIGSAPAPYRWRHMGRAQRSRAWPSRSMADLRNATGETINLIGVHGSRLVYEAVLEGRYSLRSLPSLGMTVAAHCSALGKAVLAAAPAPLREVTPRTRAVPAIHRKHHHHPARTGYQASRDQTAWIRDRRRRERDRPHLRGRRHPQHRRPGRAAAISVSGLSDRMHQLDLPQLGKRVQACCASIAAALQETGS